MHGPEKNSYKEYDNEKKFLQLENSPPPITFLMIRPLGAHDTTFKSKYHSSYKCNERQDSIPLHS